jgi:hypothetical protein
VERLEDRTLLSLINWTGGAADNNWDTPANWSGDAVPTASDDVVVGGSFAGTTIFHPWSVSDAVNSINSQAAIDITGGSLAIVGASTTDNPSGTSTINNALTVASTLTISGNLSVDGTFTWNAGSTLSGSGTLDAYGGMAIDTTQSISYLSGLTLNNHGTAIWTGLNYGSIYASNGATVNNMTGATFNAQVDGRLTWDPAVAGGPAPPVFNNAGTFIRSGDANQTDINIPFNNTGSVSLQAGFLHLGESDYPIVSTSTGSFTGAAGTTFYLTDEVLTAASSLAGDTVSLGRVTDAGNYTAASGTSANNATFTGPVQNLGNSFDVYGTVSFNPASPVTLTTGTFTVHDGATLSGVDSFAANGPFSLGVETTLSGPYTIDAWGGMSITTYSYSHIDGVTLNNYGMASWTGTAGAIFGSHGATINNLAGATFNAQADAELAWDTTQPGSVPVFNNAGILIRSGDTGMSDIQLAFTNSGSVSVQNGTLAVGSGAGGSTTNAGQITVFAGARLYSGLYTQTGGSTTLGGGTLVNGPFVIEGGALTGSGTVSGNITNGGQVIPGGTGAAGTLAINGDYTQMAAGSLNVELGGTTPGSQYDQLDVSGTATLGGTLNVATIGSFSPAFGNTLQVMTFTSSSGNFATYTAPSLASGLFLDPVYSAGSLNLATDQVAITGAPALPLQGIPIALSSTITGPSAGNRFSFAWNLAQNGNPFTSGTGSTLTFTPNLNGTYQVILTVTDAAGGRGTTTSTIVVAPSIFVLNSSASGALTVSGNASINIPGQIVVDSSSSSALKASGNAQVAGTVIDVQGGFQTSGNATITSAPTTGVSLPDPFAALAGPSTTGLNSYGAERLSGNSSGTICPGIYSQITVSGNASLTLNPGVYIIEGGGLTVTGNASISGSGVMIYNAGSNYPSSGGNFGGVTFTGNGTFSLSGPTTGAYAGVLIFQSRQNTRALSFSGNAMAGMTGTIYAANASLSMSGNSSLQNPLVVGMLNLSGNVSLTQTTQGTDGSGDAVGLADTLMAGNLEVYINDPNTLFTADELARIQDAINNWDTLLVPYNVAITEVSDPTLANLVIDTGSTSACGGQADGVLGCFNSANSEITLIQGWNWYAGADPTQIGSDQYDFETTVTHELGHALGLGHSPNVSSPMYETLATGVASRTVNVADLNIPDPPSGADPQRAALRPHVMLPAVAAQAPPSLNQNPGLLAWDAAIADLFAPGSSRSQRKRT